MVTALKIGDIVYRAQVDNAFAFLRSPKVYIHRYQVCEHDGDVVGMLLLDSHAVDRHSVWRAETCECFSTPKEAAERALLTAMEQVSARVGELSRLLQDVRREGV